MSENKDDVPVTSSNSLLDVLGKIAGFLTLITAYLFFAGYLFLDSYYGSLGVPIWLLDLPAYTYLVYSAMLPLWILRAIAILVVPALVLLYVVRRKLPSRISEQVSVLHVLLLATIVFVVVFFFAVPIGSSQGKRLARDASDPVRLTFKPAPSDSPRDPQLLKANNEGRLRMITQTKDLVLIFEPGRSGAITTFIVSRSELTSVREFNIPTK